MKERFRYQELDAAGFPIGGEHHLTWSELRFHVAIICPEYSMRDLAHMVNLLKAGDRIEPGHCVELLKWNDKKTALIWSARLWLLKPLLG
jgi:hypothetical protein